jgi:hypothetical protein
MANDLGTMKTEVRLWFDVDDVRLADAPLERIINDVCRDLYRRGDFMFMQDTDTSLTTVSGTQAYTLPSTVGRVIGVYVTNSGDNYWLTYLDPVEFDAMYSSSTTTGSESHYTLWAGTIKIGPTPAGAYQISILNFKYPTLLEDDTDTNTFLDRAWDVILYGTLAEVAKYLMEQDRIMEFSSEYEKRFRRFLIDQTRGYTGSSRPVSVETRF